MARIPDRYYPYIRFATAFWLNLLLVEQTMAQPSSGWGTDSLYHMEHGIRGAASCASAGCHGGPKPGVTSPLAARGSEYSLWLAFDPHANSWKTMSSPRSVAILHKLNILQGGTIANVAAFKNCLACHNTDRVVLEDQSSPRFAEGVGCESCHGPSEPWYARHYQGPNSKTIAVETLGLTDSAPLLRRAKLCATCHVGSKDRDMNHDMIAAGHPALYFDMAVYHEAYPKHWRESKTSERDFRSKLWLAGKIAMADSELELIESRANKSHSNSTWPELSNYQCNRCHVALDGAPNSKNTPGHLTGLNGRAPVRNWNLAGIELLAAASDLPLTDLTSSLTDLRVLMELASPDSERISELTRKLRTRLFEVVAPNGNPTLPNWSKQKQLRMSVQLVEKSKQDNSWESASGAYTAMWATKTTSTPKQLDTAMTTMRNGLLFPKGMLSPNFPRASEEQSPPSLEQWDDALRLAVEAMQCEECK